MAPPPDSGSPDAGLVVAVVLAGGAGTRLGGADKAALVVNGRTLLDRVLTAAAQVAGRLVVVGPARPVALERAVIFVHEAEPGGGPVPAVGAALDATGGASIVLLLAVDLPLLLATDLQRLIDALLRADPPVGAVAASDPSGWPNPLLAAYRSDDLRRAATRPEATAGAPASRLLPADVAVVDLGPEATLNVNTPADLERARALDLAGRGRSGPMAGATASFADDYAAALGRAATTEITLGPEEVEVLLDLARDVAHGTERRFAPLASYLAGQYVAARARDGVPVRQAVAEAADVANRLLAGKLDTDDDRE